MRDEKLVSELWVKCKDELAKLDEFSRNFSSYTPANFVAASNTLYVFRERVLLMMERLATGNAVPGGMTAWDHLNKDDP